MAERTRRARKLSDFGEILMESCLDFEGEDRTDADQGRRVLVYSSGQTLSRFLQSLRVAH
jgi:hypothetical protein